MSEVRTIGLDLAKNVFQVHGADETGAVVFRKQLRRGPVLKLLVPRQHSTGGKQRLGSTTKMGERSLRRLLIIGANSELVWRTRKGPPLYVAGKDDGAQTTDAGESSACQQDGAHRLGYHGQGRNIQSSGCCGINQANVAEGTSQQERSLEGMAQRS